MVKLDQHKKIGLLGGSFNPAHAGHLHISEIALKHFGLDEIWWVVAKQNPLKSESEMAGFSVRFASATRVTKNNPHIKISDFEQSHDTQYSFDTIAIIKKQNPDDRFLWIMGADNLANFHKWHKWQEIAKMISIAVMDREDLAPVAMSSVAAKYMQGSFLPEEKSQSILQNSHPKWCFLHIDKHPDSSTRIRKSESNIT